MQPLSSAPFVTIARVSAAFFTVVAALTLAAPIAAQELIYDARLLGSSEVPANASTATGAITLTLDVSLHSLTINASYDGLVGGPPTGAHVHCCAPVGTNTVVAVLFPGFPSGVSGTYNHTLDMTQTSSYGTTFVANSGGSPGSAFNALVAGLNAGNAYADIHDTAFPAGELRANLVTAPALQNTSSRKTHGAAGTFDVLLSPVPTTPTTEPRQGPVQTIVFTFDKPMNAATANVIEGTATAGTPTFSGNDVVVGLTGVSNQQYVTVFLTAVSSTDGGFSGGLTTRVGFLAGDVNQNRVVSVADLALVNAQLAQPVTAANFLKDVNASGTLSVADKAITNANLTKALPAP